MINKPKNLLLKIRNFYLELLIMATDVLSTMTVGGT